MKKKLLLICLSFSLSIYSQPNIQWQKSFGGTNAEVANSVVQTSDGGYAVAGYSDSNDGDITGHHGTTVYSDFWIMKLNASGALQWEKSIGGSGDDIAYAIIQTNDGGYAVAGYSQSNDGDVTGHQGLLTQADYWIVKLDTSGTIEWQKSFGGTKSDVAFSIIQTADNGYAIAGYTFSNDGDVIGQHLSGPNQVDDYWILKLDSAGTIEWQKCLGGVSNDEAHSIIQTADGGYAVAGITSSNYSGDVTQNHGSYDYWVVKLDTVGTLQWQKLFGGNNYDYAWSILPSSDGGYTVGGYSNSTNGNVTGNHGNEDYWIIKIDSAGTLQWEHTYGGTGFENTATLVKTSEGGYALGGYTTSNNGDVTGNHGASDFWLVKMDSSGIIEWQKTMGGTSNEASYSLIQSADGGYLLAGHATSSDGDVTSNQGTYDYWLVKLYSCVTSLNTINETSCNSYTLNAQTYISSGTYTQTFNNAHACDSILTINLTINTIDSTTVNASAYCSYTLNSQTYTASGTYTQQLTNAHTCDSVVVLNLTINTIDPGVNQAGVSLTAVEPGAAYQWIDCGNGNSPIQSETNQTFIATSNGNYAVIISNGNCIDTSACMSVFSVGVNSLTLDDNELIISPNPFKEQTTLSFANEQKNTVIKITDILGKEVNKVILYEGKNLTIERKDMRTGIYFIEATTNDLKIIRKKIIID